MNPTRLGHRALGTVVVAGLAAVCWWGWMGWDRAYQVDPSTGVASGPYEAWQVAGCAVCLAAVAWLAAARLPAWIVLPVLPLAFTAAWTSTAAAHDPTGLWAVGAVLVLTGTFLATALVLVVAAGARRVSR